ncbi:MAG: hypothetical protein PHG69_03035 [Candidatus Omnitrophica bacterium]|nr:hypothetical protein [Candidatus Omnitrophota bacterium]
MKIKHIGVLILCIFLIGCSTVGYYHLDDKELGKSDISRFDDIPVPSGFKFLPLNSFVYESGKIRLGVLEYSGKSFPYRIVKFYRDSMESFGWQTFNIIEGKETTLSFGKAKEICIIKFAYQGSLGSLIISISPLYEKEPIPAKSVSKKQTAKETEE